jgi:peroxiredoxin Q/BCP
MLEIGDPAPEFSLPDQSGNTVTVAWPWPDGNVKAIVLFFYPKANTSGCTVEACAFRDIKAEFDATGVVLLGISPDPVKAQQKFADKFDLPMPLLADADHAVTEAFGVWVEKSMYGKKYMGASRDTFVIAPDGTIKHLFHKVKPDGHAAEVLAFVKRMLTT